MRTRLIRTYGEFLARRHRAILLVCFALVGLGVAILPRLEFRTSRSALASPDNRDEALFDDYLSDFGPNAVVAVVEGGTEPQRRAFVDRFAAALLARKDLIRHVSFRIPLDFLLQRFPGLLPAGELLSAIGVLEKETAILGTLAGIRDLPDIHKLLRERTEAEFKAGRRPEGGEAEKGLQDLLEIIQAQKLLMEKPAAAAEALERLDIPALARLLVPRISEIAGAAGDSRLSILESDGYIASKDGTLYLVAIQPLSLSDEPDVVGRLLKAIRADAEAARKDRPDVRYVLTGIPVTIVEESDTVARDVPVCSLAAACGIGLLAALAFRRKVAVLLVLAALGAGILWNFGVTWAVFGGINMITSAVPVILMALGIDFGIHVVIGFEAERALGKGAAEAIGEALVRVGPGLITGAITTSLAFFSICFMEYRGFKEFGAVAGSGVLTCLLAMITVLPALLVLTDRRPSALARPAGTTGQGKRPHASFAPIAEEIVEDTPDIPSSASGLGRAWHAACRGVTAFPVLTILGAAAVTGVFLWLATGIGFDYRVEDLLPRNAESIVAQKKLEKHPEFSPEFAVILAKDLQGLRAAAEKSKGRELIGRKDSILDLLPEDPPEVRKTLLERIGQILKAVDPDPARLPPVDPKALAVSIRSLGEVFNRALDMAANLKDGGKMVGLLDRITEDLEATAEAVDAAAPGWAEEYGRARGRIWAWARARKGDLDAMLAAGPVAEKELPREILEHYKGSRTGRYALYLYPTGSLENREALQRFVAAVREVDREVTGYPAVFYASTELVHRGFDAAVLAAAVVILATLFIDFRRPGLVLLATLPKLLGIIWMLGIMRILKINYNLANQIVVPLIIGVGLAYGIHIIHRFIREKPEDRDITKVLEHTGGAITLSGLTTMLGFGSLALASHRGMASMGMVLFFGVGAALVASTVVLANILVVIYRPKR